MTAVILHVGLPKTGTSTIQFALQDHQAALAREGVLFPTGSHEKQRHAAFDLVGQRVEGQRAPIAGAFRRMVEEIHAYDGRAAVFSDEELGLARPARCVAWPRRCRGTACTSS